MSDLGRLFRLCQVGPKPLENFTTAALAIAIDHDSRPMKTALKGLKCQSAGTDPVVEKLARTNIDNLRVTAKTQVPLYAVGDADQRYLDLVLTFDQHCAAVWVEVKVDASESGEQIAAYRKHAERQPSRPAIITLGRDRVKAGVPFLTWSNIVAAVQADADRAWLDLRDFLDEQDIVHRPVTLVPLDADACIKVLVAVNDRIRDLWPEAQSHMAWVDGTLRSKLWSWFKSDHTMCTTGGPLHYGLTCDGEASRWFLAVRTKNYERLPLRRDDFLRDAEAGALPQDWTRQPPNEAVLERQLRAATVTSHDAIVGWFDEGLRQLRDAKILNRYLDGLTAKYVTSEDGSTRAEGSEEERQA